MYYSAIKNCDIANGTGVRVSIFVSGCTNHCKNCFQPETWDFEYGNEFTSEVEDKIIEMMKPSYINGITILGGEPMEPRNQSGVKKLIDRVRFEYPEKTIWIYSGFTYEDIIKQGAYPNTKYTSDILMKIDVLVDGKFKQELASPVLKFRGSSNQRIIDIPRTIISKEVKEIEYDDRQLNK